MVLQPSSGQEAILDIFMNHNVTFWNRNSSTTHQHKLVGEEPLFIQVHHKTIYTTMRTPGDETAHAAGFCLSQGIIAHRDDIGAIGSDDRDDTNVINVTLKLCSAETTAGRHQEDLDIHKAGKADAQSMIDELCRSVGPFLNDTPIAIDRAFGCIDTLADHQQLRHFTGASHAAAIYGCDYQLMAVSEDVGRHNALDKVVGKLLLSGELSKAAFLVLSSRISFELVQKAARARIPIIISVSRPTALAVKLASKLNMTLACLAKGSGLFIFCGQHRLPVS